MTYAFVQDVPANVEMYEKIRGLIGDDVPAGLVSHVVIKREHGLRYVDVWETKAQWEHFAAGRVEPAVGQVLASYGLPHDRSMVTMEEVEVVDVWQPATSLR